MNSELIQHLRYKLQKRVRRLNSVELRTFLPTLRQFWVFFDNHPILSGVLRALVARFPETEDAVTRTLAYERVVAATEEEAAAIGHGVLRGLSDAGFDPWIALARNYGPASDLGAALEVIREVFLEPFYEYVDESLDDERAMLALLVRYKHRCEWFQREHVWKLFESETRKAEKRLALDLYSYLHDQGIEFSIEPSS